jgi:predicted PilT family ATPase
MTCAYTPLTQCTRLHDKVRGERGIIINALNPSSVFVQFGIPPARPGRPAPVGDQNAENIITLRGPPANVNTTAANILTFLNDTKDKAVPDTVAEPFEYRKQYSGNLIGSKGANINKLRDELGVDIKLTEGIGEIRGFKVCVDAARRKLNSQIKELDDKAVITIKVPQQYHSIIIGSEGSTVKRLEERYSVRINFPRGQKPDEGRENSPRQAPDEIIIRGGKKGADEARQEIDDLWKYEAENSYTATITVLAKSVGYMFRNASKDIKQLRDESSARITIPQEDKNANPDDTVEIKIRGKKDAVTHAQSVLAKIAKNAENTSSVTINVEKKYHRSLIGFAGRFTFVSDITAMAH